MVIKSESTNLDYFFYLSPDPMTIATLEGVLVDANLAWKDILEFEPEEIRGRSVFDFIHPDDVPRFGAQRERMMTNELTAVRVEFRGRHRDGTYRWLESHAVRRGDFIYGIQRDIDKRKCNELTATESLRMTRAILEAAADSIVVIDRNLIVVDVSPGTERVYGLTPEQCIGLNVLGVVHNQDQPSITSAIERLFTGESEEVQMARFRAIRADGQWITIESRARLLIDADGSSDRAVLVSRDVTEAEAAQSALAAAKAEAEQANLAKSEFLSRMSHELRTPLNSVLGFAQLLQMEADTKTGHEAVDYIYTSGRHLLNLIDEILDISRVESGTLAIALEPLDVDELVKESVALFSLQATALGVTIIIDGRAGMLVEADGQRLKQVLINLLSNAVKFNHREGTVVIHFTESSGRVRISITDSGPGIAPENWERLFAPFDRLDAEARGIEGTGLGLALSKGLVEAIGGSLDFESTLGVGSSFWVELPIAEGVVKSPRDVERAPHPAISSAGATVLYIEDNISNLRLVERLLTHRPNVRLISALQGRLGRELAIQHRPDLILLDVHLPDIPGFDVLQRLRADPSTADIPVVMLSADATPSQIERFLNAGAADYLVKPLDLNALLAMIDELLTANAGNEKVSSTR